MRSLLHNAAAGSIIKMLPAWVGSLHAAWEEDLLVVTTPRTTGFFGRHRRSKREPDYAIFPPNQSFPSIVVEAGVSEKHADLLHDKDLWLHHTNNEVKVVIIVRFDRRVGGVRGFFEIWRAAGSARYELFLVPAGNLLDPTMTLGELYVR